MTRKETRGGVDRYSRAAAFISLGIAGLGVLYFAALYLLARH